MQANFRNDTALQMLCNENNKMNNNEWANIKDQAQCIAISLTKTGVKDTMIQTFNNNQFLNIGPSTGCSEYICIMSSSTYQPSWIYLLSTFQTANVAAILNIFAYKLNISSVSLSLVKVIELLSSFANYSSKIRFVSPSPRTRSLPQLAVCLCTDGSAYSQL